MPLLPGRKYKAFNVEGKDATPLTYYTLTTINPEATILTHRVMVSTMTNWCIMHGLSTASEVFLTFTTHYINVHALLGLCHAYIDKRE